MKNRPSTIGIVTCKDKPDLITGDKLLCDQLRARGHDVRVLVWTDTIRPESKFDFDVVIIRSTWDYHLRASEFIKWLERIEAQCPVINDPSVIRWNLKKSYLLELEKAGVSVVPTLLTSRTEEAETTLRRTNARGWTDLVVKPLISASAHLTFRSSPSELLSQLPQVYTHSDAIIQPFIPSIANDGELSLIVLNLNNQLIYSHAVLKRARPGDFRVQSEFGGTEEPFAAHVDHQKIAFQAVREIKGNWLFARVDLVDWKSKALVGEVELIEPDLFLQMHPESAFMMAREIERKYLTPSPSAR